MSQRLLDEWSEGEPVPLGYHPAHRTISGLIGGGIGLFLPVYLISSLGALGGEGLDPSGAWWLLTVPVVGPLIGISALQAKSAGVILLAVDGLLQAGGVAMIVVGAVGKTALRRDLAGTGNPLELRLGNVGTLEATPLFNMGALHTGNGAALQLTF